MRRETPLEARIPPPEASETPTAYADRLGHTYTLASTDEGRRTLGQYLTPPAVALFMARLAHPKSGVPLRAIDPGAGGGVLSAAVVETLATSAQRPASLHLVAFESDVNLARLLEATLSHAATWARAQSFPVTFEVRASDFVLAEAASLTRADATGSKGEYGLVMSNPPYLKVPKDDPRAQAAASVVHGQPNLYGFFMAIGAALLAPGGDFVFITPRSYASGPYFRLFRERFFGRMRPEAAHLFGSRQDAFRRDEVLQENVILHARRDDGWLKRATRSWAVVSHSEGTSDLEARTERRMPLSRMVDTRNGEYVLRLPVSDADDHVLDLVDLWSGRLEAHGWRISTGRVVPFRTDAIEDSGKVPETHAPLLWMQNVRAMRAEWPVVSRKAQYIRAGRDTDALLVPNRNYVVLRRFSAKEEARRLVAAPLLARTIPGPRVGLENHLNYVHKPSGSLTEHEALGLAALLNSRLMDAYFRVSNGNTQVSATELRALPLPPREAIERLGALVVRSGSSDVDALVKRVLDVTLPTTAHVGASTHG